MKLSDILPVSLTKKQLIALVMYKAVPSMLRIHIIFNSPLAKWLNGFLGRKKVLCKLKTEILSTKH